MKKYKNILLICFLFSLNQINSFAQNNKNEEEGIWTGTVSFLEKRTGKNIIISEWSMEAKITSNKGTAVHAFHFKDKNNNTSDCKNEEETDLGVGIDYETATYSIDVPMPGCYGKQISGGNTSDFAQTDETAIRINDQPLKDPNLLTGTLTEKSGVDDNSNETVTTYTWRLERKNKVKKTLQSNNNKKPEEVQHISDESWNGKIVYTAHYFNKGQTSNAGSTDTWNKHRNVVITIDVKDIKGMAKMTDTIMNWEKTTAPFTKDQDYIQIVYDTTYGKGKDEVEVWVEIDKEQGTYWIKTNGPPYTYDVISGIQVNIGESKRNVRTDSLFDGILITIPDQKIGNNPNVLTGTYTVISSSTVLAIAKWDLTNTKAKNKPAPQQPAKPKTNSDKPNQ